ncbi:hypothetical protein DIE14_07050 [Burkholderia sp. Bp9017]|uniref:Uncharacterized protein n=1 Tax=Burkholderia anthina TaxID=179879 RepID=A0A7T6VL14_9BURK|nr:MULTISPECIES: aminoglycoside phosphotransferase family protein [Burkholderia]MBY4867319.1 hypothetical protein [Burkholderia anthina]QQK05681.1 hypothetical protein JFN94_17385 [Burkholderia anthina]RQZ29246.1 hypothetical protein DIE14_07050 [Burkholderia sp. Bp9017]RQZ36005.1 hypothetical protein DIE13_08015 [Burkholderia sp. Bp9016]
MFDTCLRLWDLVPDGGPILTACGGVLPNAWHARPAMLKIATCDEARRVMLVANAAQLDLRRLLQWILAWAGLSASWLMEDEQSPDTRLQVAALAATALGA